MPDSLPATRKRHPAIKRGRPAIGWATFWRAIVVLGVLIASCAFLFGRAAKAPALDANGNPVLARDYGFGARR